MTLSELIKACGDEQVRFQNLDHCALNLDYHAKSGTKITFGTEEPLNLNGTHKLGLVVWLDRNAVKAAIDAERSTLPQEQTQ